MPRRLYINVELVDAETGGQVWSDRIEVPRALWYAVVH
jgi:TolB-like protein